MSCRIEFTDTAKQDLREIAFYIAEQAKDKNIAIRFVKELQEKYKNLYHAVQNNITFITEEYLLNAVYA